MIISADIGGTKTSIGLSRVDDPINYKRKITYMNDDFDSFEDIVNDFSSKNEIEIMVLGIAGPITGRVVDLTNLDWTINADDLEEKFESRVFLLNDLQAAAHSLPYLTADNLDLVYKANNQRNSNTKVIVSAGTGLGVAKMYQTNDQNIVFASEGGHIGFNPKTEFQEQLFSYISSKENHVSCEMMFSSMGFKNLRKYILNENSMGYSDQFLDILNETIDIPRVIIKNSQQGNHDGEISKMILSEFSLMLGNYLGDMVLVHLPSAIYLTGGIGRNIPDPEFLKKGFLQKANMSHVVEQSSLSIITDPDCALHGTSWFATENL